jgi:hypothetical protein
MEPAAVRRSARSNGEVYTPDAAAPTMAKCKLPTRRLARAESRVFSARNPRKGRNSPFGVLASPLFNSVHTGEFGGGGGNNAYAPASTDWDFGTGDFTIGGWQEIGSNTEWAVSMGRYDGTNSVEIINNIGGNAGGATEHHRSC